jgi:hypothetical protein
MVEFPVDEVRKSAAALPPLPKGFAAVIPTTEAHFSAWVALLNEEPGFGCWTMERLKTELLAKLVPSAALLVLHEGRAIACACATDASTPRRKIAVGMFLYVVPKYRRKAEIAAVTTFGMLNQCVIHGYQEIVASTDPERLSALALYLSNGSRPVCRTFGSWLRWRRILKRLGPTLEKMQRRQARRRALQENQYAAD